MNPKATIAIVGATGAVGETMREVLAEREVPASQLRLVASTRSAGRRVTHRGERLEIVPLEAAAFEGVDLALFALANDLAEEWVPQARARGVRVVDNSSRYRLDPEVPLVVPEVNGDLLDDRPGLVANPNCSTIIMVTALAPIARAAGLRHIVGVTFQSASGAGTEAVGELDEGARAILAGETPPHEVFPVPLAFDCLPMIGSRMEDGSSREEWKMRHETQRILGLEKLHVAFTCVRVPTRIGHAIAVHFATRELLSADEARALLMHAKGVRLTDAEDLDAWPTPKQSAGTDGVLVGRVRHDGIGLSLWAAGDNLRKGAATNAIDIAAALLAE